MFLGGVYVRKQLKVMELHFNEKHIRPYATERNKAARHQGVAVRRIGNSCGDVAVRSLWGHTLQARVGFKRNLLLIEIGGEDNHVHH
jgi:hypothetical protein